MRPIFITGCERSGTTMLASMLGSASDYITTPECQFKIPLMNEIEWSNADISTLERSFELINNHFYFKIWGIDAKEEQYKRNRLPIQCRSIIEWIVTQYNIQKQQKSNPEVWFDHDPRSIRSIELILKYFPDAKFIHIVRDGRAVTASVLPLDWGPNTAKYAAFYWRENIAFGLDAEKKVWSRLRNKNIL